MGSSDRYLRQTSLAEIGAAGQERLRNSTVLVAGCGALGSNSAEIIARAGVGRIILVDSDTVEMGNLQRQGLLIEEDVGERKAAAVGRALRRINSDIEIDFKVERIAAENIERLIEGVDLVLDGFDNMPSRYLLNDACVKHGIPWIFAAVAGTFGMTMPIVPRRTACLRCLSPDPVPDEFVLTAGNAGLINTIPRAIVSLQATLALKILLGALDVPASLTTYDIWSNQFASLEIERGDHCPCCVRSRYEFLQAGDDLERS